MAPKHDLPISSCWIITEDLVGLRNQAIGLAQALGVPYALKEAKRSGFFSPALRGLNPPWPDLLITCGRKSVVASVAVRRASQKRTFTVHVQDPLTDPGHFDAVIVPEHDRLRGDNVFVTKGAIHHVTAEKLMDASLHFHDLLAPLPRPLISVLVGGKNKHQDFSAASARDLAGKLVMAAGNSGGGLAVTVSRRTGRENETILRQAFAGVPSYIWDGRGENPYFGLLALAQAIVVTSDSLSMVSESCSTGKPVYIYELPHCGRRHRQFCDGLVKEGRARPFTGRIESWSYAPLNETRRAADFIHERFWAKRPALKFNAVH